MTPTQLIQLRQSGLREKISELLNTPLETRSESFTQDLGALTSELKESETELQAALLIEPTPTETRTEIDPTSEDRELIELRSQTNFGKYVAASLTGGGVRDGAEMEYNQHLGIELDRFPMEMLTRDLDDDLETRAAVDGDSKTNQGTWVDRLFADSAAMRLGITMPSVPAGIASYPVTTDGGAPVQRARAEDAAVGTFAVTVSELKPTRNAVHLVYTIEDDARLPGMAAAIQRDMRAAMVARIDRTIFVGDAGASGTDADIKGLTTAAGIGEKTITQSNKVKADKLLELFLDWIDGIHATSMDDVRMVATVGSSKLWGSTVHASTVENQTVAQFLRANGVSWTVKGDVESNSANGDFGAFAGLQRGIRGTGVAPVWAAGQLVRDPYSSAKGGEVELTLHYLWNFMITRTANYKRLKYVT